ncbi:MAG: endonuclease/exonuclease/phosphatase family protein [Verrucomicrobiota bacterium]
MIKFILATALLISSAIAADPVQLDVMSFNIRYGSANDGPNSWEHRKELVYQVLKDHQPDIVGLQEAQPFQIKAMQAACPQYALVGRSREVDPEGGEWCGIFYKEERLKLLKTETFWLSDTPEEPGSKHWGNKPPRIVTWARFEEQASGRTFAIYNTHFDHQSQLARENGAKLSLERMAAHEPKGEPIVFMGDLNADENNPVIATLSASMTDTFQLLHPEEPKRATMSRWSGNTEGRRIDYIFTSPKHWKIKRARILRDHSEDGRYPSDHYPVDARLILK